MQQQASEEELELSPEALAALASFARESGLSVDSSASSSSSLRFSIQTQIQQQQPQLLDYDFDFPSEAPLSSSPAACDREPLSFSAAFLRSKGLRPRPLTLSVSCVRRDWGQTLSSTGLTVWRAAEELARFAYESCSQRKWSGLRVLELGAGLGIVSAAAALTTPALSLMQQQQQHGGAASVASVASSATRREQLVGVNGSGTPALVVATDGDSLALVALASTLHQMGAARQVAVRRLFWGNEAHYPLDDGASSSDERLQSATPLGSGGFDVILGADVVYEEEQVVPLITTAKHFMLARMRHRQSQRGGEADDGPEPVFYLAFARRNVPLRFVEAAAREMGFSWDPVPASEFVPTNPDEPIIVMRLPPHSVASP